MSAQRDGRRRCRRHRLAARVERVIPLVGAYLLLATLYAWQAWRRETPTIFTDELELTQISRAIAETGHADAARRAVRVHELVPWLTAPFWWLDPRRDRRTRRSRRCRRS